MPNQFQQSPYQPQMYGQPFGKTYGFQQQQAVPSPSQNAGTAHTVPQQKSAHSGALASGSSNNMANNGYHYQQFFQPAMPYEEDYGKYGQQNFSGFNSGLGNTKEYKGQNNRNNRPGQYDARQQNVAAAPQGQQPMHNYYGNVQVPGMYHQPFMMQPGYPQQQMHQPNGYPSQRGGHQQQPQQGYWNGN